MKHGPLGETGLTVSKLCFGSLTIGPLQKNMTAQYGAGIIIHALESEINFIDTAEIYGTYAHISEAVRLHTANGGKMPVVATKCYAYEADTARASLEKARKEMNVDVIDIFMLHEQESRLTLRGHMEATEFFLGQKSRGVIKAFGVSTHNIEVVRACADLDYIDVIHPIVNISGLGINDGSIAEMLVAVENARAKGKGVYSMKALGGGNLIGSYVESMRFVLGLGFIDSIAVGMQSEEEIDCNVRLLEGENVDGLAERLTNGKLRRLNIEPWCSGCGKCVIRCKQSALSFRDGKPRVNQAKCVLCGYCAGVCPDFAIKVY